MAGPEEPEQATKRAKTCAAAESSAPAAAGEGSTAHPGEPEMQAAAGGGGREDPRASAFAARPIPRRRRPRPKSGDSEDMKRWLREGEEITKQFLRDPSTHLPTRNGPCGSGRTDGVVSTEHKRVVCDAARSIVAVFSLSVIAGEEKTRNFTGIVVAWDEADKRATILTSSRIVCNDKDGLLLDPIPELSIHFPDKTVTEGHLLFFNDHYSIALLEILTDFPMHLPSFGPSPSYGQKVFVLTRDCLMSLRAMHRQILWAENSEYLHHSHYFLLSEQPWKYCNMGGAVVNHDGKIIGMVFDQSQKTVICISIVLTCIKMWTKFSRIACPVMGMSFRTVELQDVSKLEQISHDYNIKDGFIVHRVSFDSIAERLGFRKGDVVVSFNGQRFSTLSQLEDFLLNLGWEFLEGVDSSSMVNVELDVHDLLRRDRLNITLPMGFSDACEREVEEYNE